MNRMICLSLLLATQFVLAPLHAAPSPEANFQGELKTLLARGLESKRGLVFHLNGEELAGVVKQIYADAVLVTNQEHSTILIRLDRIDAIELD